MLFLFAQFELANPGRLTALLLLPLFVFIAYRYARFDGWQRTAALVCRLSIIALVVFALAGPYLSGVSHRRFVVFAVDGSASVQGTAHETASKFVEQARGAAGENKIAVLNFAAQPESQRRAGDVSLPNSESPERHGGRSLQSAPDADASDPAAAILAAAASIPAGYVPEVVLLSDGRQTRGDLLTVAARAGAPVSVVPLPAFSAPEVGIVSVDAPAMARPGETVAIQVVVTANEETLETVAIRNGHSQQLQLSRGENRLTLNGVMGRDGATTFEISVAGQKDHFSENNRAVVVVYAAPPIKALVVDSDATRGERLATVLKEQEIKATAQATLPQSATELVVFDVLLLAGLAPQAISDEQAATLEAFVRQRGGGLIVSGPAATFGSAAYQSTALEKLLPVTALPKVDERKQSLALTLVIDRSASMLEENRLGLAKEAAKLAVGLLAPQDKAGVVVFGSDTEWISELGPCRDKTALLESIAALKAEGQTNMYPALVKAYLALEQADADKKHVILLTDGTPSPGDFQQIAARMAAAGITVSTVSISKGAEQSILKDISLAAKGKHHHCNDPKELATILVQETKSAAATSASEFQPIVFRHLPGLDVATAPPLSGAVAVSPKQRAELLLIGAEGDPLLSWWRYGEGVTVALAADVRQPWSGWQGYGPFWRRLVNHAARDSTPLEYSFALRNVTGRGIATLEALTPEGKFLNGAKAVLRVPIDKPLDVASANVFTEMEFDQIAPGRYQAEFAVLDTGLLEGTAILYDPAEPSRVLYQATRSLAPSYADEFRLGPTDETLLREVARVSGGAYNPQPEEIFAPTERSVLTKRPLTWYFVLAAALLLVADVTVRRYHEWIGTPRSTEQAWPSL